MEKRRQLECLRCGHQWFTKLEVVRRCARCKSPYWDVARGHTENPARVVVAETAANSEQQPKTVGMMFPKDKWKVGGAKGKWRGRKIR